MSVVNKIATAKKLEDKLNEYKLHTDLIPQQSWYINLRYALKQDSWNKIRKAVIKSQRYHCSICNVITSLHVHEKWKYNYSNQIQQIEQLEGICHLCHLVIHLGYAEVKAIPNGSTNMNELAEHWSNVNEQPKYLFFRQKEDAYHLWAIRNSIQWIIMDQKGTILVSR